MAKNGSNTNIFVIVIFLLKTITTKDSTNIINNVPIIFALNVMTIISINAISYIVDFTQYDFKKIKIDNSKRHTTDKVAGCPYISLSDFIPCL